VKVHVDGILASLETLVYAGRPDILADERLVNVSPAKIV